MHVACRSARESHLRNGANTYFSWRISATSQTQWIALPPLITSISPVT